MNGLVITTRKSLEKEIQKRVEESESENTKKYERDLLMKQTDLAALQSQINPHFLYNSLECIRGQALIDGSETVADITKALSLFFRYSISGKKDLAYIIEELENARNYMKIQQFRFENRFQFNIEVDNENIVNTGILPKLSLQPLLENAIIHGFADISSGGEILITVKQVNEDISIVVSDNGCGMNLDQLKALQDSLHQKDDHLDAQEDGEHTGIGLSNVDRRLKLMFGPAYGLSIDSVYGSGTKIELFFPYVIGDEDG